LQQGVESLSGALAAYRMFLYLEGSEEREAVDENGKPVRGALRREAVLKVLQEKGKLPLAEYLRCRVRYFCDGAVFGRKEFVEGMFRECRGWFGERRKSGARRMRGRVNRVRREATGSNFTAG
jgi:putative transposase